MTSLLILIALSSFLILGTPVAFAMGITAIVGMWLTGDNLAAVPKVFYETFSIYELLAVPLFILMSQVLLVGKMGEYLFEVINRWVRHWPGGLGIATVLSCGFFSAVAGSSTATAATVGATAIPAMLKRNYPKSFAFGMVAGGGTLGILIPPSIPFILYAAITGESVGKLFLAGIVPGLLIILLLIIYIIFLQIRTGSLPRESKASIVDRISITLRHTGAIMLPVVVLGGIYGGLFTPTEAAAAGAIYSILLCVIGYRTLGFRDFMPILMATLRISCMIMFIIAGALVLSRVLTTLQIAPNLIHFFEEQNFGKWVFIILMNILWLIMGTVMEVASIMLITLPIAFPIAVSMGIDPFWFAVIMVINMELATISPPIGLNIFVLMGIMNEKDEAMIVRGVLPPFLIIGLGMILIMIFPSIATWLPSLQ
jgi:C4-dicarboxylate transporter DctM subunit